MKVYTYTNLEFEMVYAYSLKIEIVPLEYLLIHKLKSIKRILYSMPITSFSDT